MTDTRHFLDFDEQHNLYIIPTDRGDDWEEWRDNAMPGDEPPDYVRYVGGSPSLVTFTDPQLVA